MKRRFGFFLVAFALLAVMFSGCSGDEPVADHNKWFQTDVVYNGETVKVAFYYQDAPQYTGNDVSEEVRAKMNQSGLYIALIGFNNSKEGLGNSILNALTGNICSIVHVTNFSQVWTGIYLANIKKFINGGSVIAPAVLKNGIFVENTELKNLFPTWEKMTGTDFSWKSIVKSLVNGLL